MAAEYKVLSDIEHIRHRPQMYVGSTELEKKSIFTFADNKMRLSEIYIIPAFMKIVDEILDNAVDEHKRNPTKLNKLSVSFDDGKIVVEDNGGIPVRKHDEYGIMIPELIFSQLRSGSNYNDDEERMLAGVHGIGAKATNILSREFVVETADGKNSFYQKFTSGMTVKTEPLIKKSSKNYTKISFVPDYEFFKVETLSEDHKSKILRRLIDIAGTNPLLSVSCNSTELTIKNFSDYIKLYSEEFVYEDYGDWKIGISASSGFQHTSFVNSVETYMGGTHVEYVSNQIVEALRAYVKKKHKIEVKPSDIKNQMHVFISCNINRPKFSSQTKENMVSAVSSFGTSVTISDKFIGKVVKSEIVQKILDWAAAKQAAAEAEELRKAEKSITKANPKNIAKFDDAVERIDRRSCTLFLSEGLSAKNSVISARGKNKYFACYALKGKIVNVDGMKPKDVLENTEISDILTITGLKLGEPIQRDSDSTKWFIIDNKLVNEHDVIWTNGECIKVWEQCEKTPASPSIPEIMEYRRTTSENNIHRRAANLRFGRIVVLSDADLDGSHIAALALLLFQRFWPELFSMGCIYRMETPVYIVNEKRSKQEHFFYSIEEYAEWSKRAPAHTANYFKGLGTFKTEQFEKFFTILDELLVQFHPPEEEDNNKLTLAFNDDKSYADQRKVWLKDYSYFDKED
jgi:DNA gyrase/topoisomerase IV subunit B